MVTVWLEPTTLVETVKVADEEPAGMVTVAGTDATLELEERATTVPPAGAAEESKTVPVSATPPATAATGSVTLCTPGTEAFWTVR
jgi:hypothetical protein